MTDIESELAALRARRALDVDVSERVMARIASLPAPGVAPAARARRWGWVAAALGALVSTAGVVGSLPENRAAIAAAVTEGLALLRVAGGSSATVASIARGVSGALDLMASTVVAVATTFEPLRPTLTAMSFALAVATIVAAAAVIFRDVSRAPAVEER